MSFLDRFKRKKNPPFDVEFITKDIPLSTIARWYIYDTELAEPNEIAVLLGMNNVSEEGNEKERQDSEVRLENIDYLLPYIDAIAKISADVITSIQIKEITERNPEDKEEIEREVGTMNTLYRVVGMAAIIGAVSTATEIGLIQPGELTAANTLWDDSLEEGNENE